MSSSKKGPAVFLAQSISDEAPFNSRPKIAERATEQVTIVAKASQHLGLKGAVGFTGSRAFPYVYPLTQRLAGLVGEAYKELARRWKPLLGIYDDAGVDFGFEIHPGEGVIDGTTLGCFPASPDDFAGGKSDPVALRKMRGF